MLSSRPSPPCLLPPPTMHTCSLSKRQGTARADARGWLQRVRDGRPVGEGPQGRRWYVPLLCQLACLYCLLVWIWVCTARWPFVLLACLLAWASAAAGQAGRRPTTLAVLPACRPAAARAVLFFSLRTEGVLDKVGRERWRHSGGGGGVCLRAYCSGKQTSFVPPSAAPPSPLHPIAYQGSLHGGCPVLKGVK